MRRMSGVMYIVTKPKQNLIMRAGHRFYIKRDGSYFNTLNVHGSPEKNIKLCVHLKLHYGIIPVVRHGYSAVVPLPVLYTLLTDIMFNQFLLCQAYKFSIPIGYDLIFKISLFTRYIE